MRLFCIVLLLSGGGGGLSIASEPLPGSTNLAVISFTGNGAQGLLYQAEVVRELGFAVVVAGAIPLNRSVILARSAASPFFQQSDEVSEDRSPHVNPPDGQNRAPLTGYVAQQDFETGVWHFFEAGISVGPQTDLLVGVQLRLEDSDHYGWVRFSRPDAKPETLFQVAGHDWNPVPGAPIRAGLPPEIPIASEILPEGAGIRLTWPGGISHWILESTASLSPPILWEEYPASGGSYANVPAEDADRFFRLRRPD